MTDKSTYQELEKKIKRLEKEVAGLKLMETRLHESEEKYRSLMEAMIDPAYICSSDYRVMYMNSAMVKRVGREAIGEVCHKTINDLDEKCPWCVHEKIQQGEKAVTEIFSPKNGQNFEVLHAPIFHLDGSISKMTIYRDITGRVQIEKKLRRRTFELEERVKELNCFYEILKILAKPSFSFDETIQEIVDLIPDSWQFPEITCVQVTIDDLKYKTKNFRITDWRLTSDIIVYDERSGTIDVCYLEETPESDVGPFLKEERNLINALAEQLGRIVESEWIEDAHRESERKFRHMFENNSAIMCLIDPQTLEIIDANYAAARFYGLTRETLVTKKLADISLEAEEEIRKEVKKAGKEHRAFFVFKHKLANGEIRDVEMRSTPLIIDDSQPIYFAIIQDITNRVRIEEEKKRFESQIRQAQKMEAIGTLTGGIAHDFNNILWIISGNTELALAETQGGSPARYNLKQVEAACRRATNLVKQISSFSSQTEQVQQPLKISSIVKESLKLLRSTIPMNIEIHQNISTQSYPILADLTQINQLLLNLYTNAAYAMRENGGVLEVSLLEIELDEEESALHQGLSPGKYAILSVRDTGHGIKPENVERIFDPYFTTKKFGEGTGMGLSVVYRVVKTHGGTITVNSEPGKGTTFNIFLPRIDENEIEHETETFDALPKGNEKILFVDDEDAVLDMGKQILRRLGYQVLTCNSPIEALKSFKAHPENYDLVITDQGMPHMTGENLAKELMSIRRDIPIILCTGFSDLVSKEKAKLSGIKAFLTKPIVKGDFAGIIREILDQKG